jgi:methyl acetate hydrolase
MADTFDNTMSQDFLVQDHVAVKPTVNAIPGAVFWAIDSSRASILPPNVLGHRSVLPGAQTMSKDTVFFLASMTKLVTAVAAMQCVERGLIDLDEPVGNRLPEFEHPVVIKVWRQGEDGKKEPILRQARSQVTLRQLLCHTSGVSASIFDSYDKFLDLNRFGP